MGFMDTLGRIPKILEANINDLLDKCEDPEKMINQQLVDYKRNLAEVRKATTEVMADLKLAEDRLNKANEDIERKTRAIQAAVAAENDNDARTLIAAKQAAEVTRDQLKKNYDVCVNNANTMKAGYNKLVSDIEILEQRADVAKAQLRQAKAQQSMAGTRAKMNNTKIQDSFAKYEEKAQRELAKANAATELDATVETADQIMAKYEGSGSSSSVEAELAAMKAAMGK